jgi:hypothetical protein
MPEIHAAVVGTRFRPNDAIQAVAKMRAGDPARLVREPSNPYDANAVQVWFLSLQVGYIPRQANARLAAAMDAGIKPVASVTQPPKIRGRTVIREAQIKIIWEDQA